MQGADHKQDDHKQDDHRAVDASIAPSSPVSWQPLLSSRAVDLPRMMSVAFTPMAPALRNELITEAYGDLAEAMADCLGATDATWCTFGQWASHAIGNYLGTVSVAPGRLIARAFGHGNRQVFADISRAHVAFLDTVGRAGRYGRDVDRAWEECVRRLTQTLVPVPGTDLSVGPAVTDLTGAATADHQLLVRGFRAYRNALMLNGASSPEDLAQRSRSILLGNALLAMHEQQLLDDTIAVGFRSWLRHLTTWWTPLASRYRWRQRPVYAWQLSMEHWWIHTATRHVISIALPDRVIKVGRPYRTNPSAIPVTARALDEDLRSLPLDQIGDDDLLDGIWALLEVDGRGARCWSGLDDRLPFILCFMANEQRDPSLWVDGSLRRPVPRRPIRFRLRRLEARIAAPPSRPLPTDAPMQAQLNALRTRPTHPVHGIADDHPLLGRTPLRSVHAIDFAAAPWNHLADEFERAAQRADVLLDPSTVTSARRLFQRWTTLMYMGLLFRSLPDSYAAAHGVKVLGSVSDLATNPVRRVGETAQFLHDLFVRDESWSSGNLRRQGPAYQSVRGVRTMHTLIARQLLEADWDVASHGQPLNQEDLLGTVLSFAVPPLELMERLGIDVPPADRDRYTRFWCGVGHLLGLPLPLLGHETDTGFEPLSYDQAVVLADAIRGHQQQRSLDGVRLGEALLEGVADGFPRALDWLAGGLFHAIGDPRASELLLLADGPGRVRSTLTATTLRGLLRFGPTRGLTRNLVEAVGQFWLRPFMAEGEGRPFRRPVSDKSQLGKRHAEPGARAVDRTLWPTGCAR